MKITLPLILDRMRIEEQHRFMNTQGARAKVVRVGVNDMRQFVAVLPGEPDYDNAPYARASVPT